MVGSRSFCKYLKGQQSDRIGLFEKRYKDKKGKGLQSIDEKMLDINKSFAVIHRSSILRAAIYHEQNEFDAMLSVMESYVRCDTGTQYGNRQ